MALYIKFQNKRIEEKDFNRFRSAFKFFKTLDNVFKTKELKVSLFLGTPLDESYPLLNYDFGVLETEFRKELTDSQMAPKIGFNIDGIIEVEKKQFRFSYTLHPRILCFNSERFDVRMEIMPNNHAELFEDLTWHIPDLKKRIMERIKEYNSTTSTAEYEIKRAVMSKAGDEYENIANWDYFYSLDPNYFLTKIIDSNAELKDRLSFGNKQKFAQSILDNQDFAFLLSELSQDNRVSIVSASITIIPETEDSMKLFISEISQKLTIVAKELYKGENEAKQIISNTLSKIN